MKTLSYIRLVSGKYCHYAVKVELIGECFLLNKKYLEKIKKTDEAHFMLLILLEAQNQLAERRPDCMSGSIS